MGNNYGVGALIIMYIDKMKYRYMKKSLWIVLMGVVMLAGCGSHRQASADYSFVSFNIRLGSDWSRTQDSSNYWDFRKEAVLAMIAQESPDAMGMQEVLPGQLHFLDSALSGYQRIGVGREDGKEEGECMAVFFKKDRFELVKSHTYWLSETPDSVSMGWDAACFRTVTMALLRDKESQQQLLYMNTHLDHVSATARAESMKLLTRLATEWIGEEVPVIIGGDMNTSADDTIFDNLLQKGFFKCRDAAPITDNEMTFNGFGKTEPIQIDHYFGRNIEVKEFHTLNGDYGVPYISDHYPIKMVFRI